MLKRKKQDKKERQLGMQLPRSRFEPIFRIKRLSRQIEKNFTVLPFWRNGFIWSAICSVIGVTIISTLLIGKYYSQLPPQVPIIYDTVKEQWINYPRITLFLVPLVFVALGIININFLQRSYYMNKKMTLMICAMLAVSYVLGLVAINEILIICTS